LRRVWRNLLRVSEVTIATLAGVHHAFYSKLGNAIVFLSNQTVLSHARNVS
jgi:hypothetical protein